MSSKGVGPAAAAEGTSPSSGVAAAGTEPPQSRRPHFLRVLKPAGLVRLLPKKPAAVEEAPTVPRLGAERMVKASTSDAIPISCKDTRAVLHKDRFGSGGKGRCIECRGEWFTPNEFEIKCGRASSKDWKRSIRYAGRSIVALIHAGVLVPHATGCTCTICTDDTDALGPVRLFTPYKRKRGPNSDSNKKTAQAGGDSADGDPETGDRPQQDTNRPVSGAPPIFVNSRKHAAIARARAIYKRMVAVHGEMVRIVGEMSSALDEAKTLLDQQLPLVLGETPAAVDTKPEDKKCANCNRPSSSECSLCRRTPYCSTFCQRRDWAAHQVECLRGVGVTEASGQAAWIIVDNVQVKHVTADVSAPRQQVISHVMSIDKKDF